MRGCVMASNRLIKTLTYNLLIVYQYRSYRHFFTCSALLSKIKGFLHPVDIFDCPKFICSKLVVNCLKWLQAYILYISHLLWQLPVNRFLAMLY